MSVIRENARKTRLSGVTHEQRLADLAAKCAAAHEAAEASLQQRDAAAKAHQQAIEARLRKAILWETMPPTVTVPDLEDQLALRGIIRKYKEHIMLNWDCEAKRITTTATTPWSKLLKPDLVAIVLLFLSSSSPTITRIPMTCKYLIGISESLGAAVGASAVGAAAPEPSLATQPLHPPPAMPARVVEETTAARCSHVGLGQFTPQEVHQQFASPAPAPTRARQRTRDEAGHNTAEKQRGLCAALNKPQKRLALLTELCSLSPSSGSTGEPSSRRGARDRKRKDSKVPHGA